MSSGLVGISTGRGVGLSWKVTHTPAKPLKSLSEQRPSAAGAESGQGGCRHAQLHPADQSREGRLRKLEGSGRRTAGITCRWRPNNLNGPKLTNYRVGVVVVLFLPPFFLLFFGAFVLVSWAKETATVEVRNARPSISVINLFICASPLDFDDCLVSGAIITAPTLIDP